MTAADPRDGLLPCPFCGGVAELADYECGRDGMPRDFRNPRCTECYVCFGYAQKERAIAMWNRRAAIAHARPEAVDQKRALERLVGAAGLMLAEIEACGHEVDPTYRLYLHDAWTIGKAALTPERAP